jgi:uncharacterized protein YqfA (UPF0365 family)
MTLVAVLLTLLPALLLVAALTAGHYPGEVAIAKLRGRMRERRHAAAKVPRPARRARSPRRRAGELLSNSLAGRAPPAAPA